MGVFVILLLVPLLMQHVTLGKQYVNSKAKNSSALLFFFLLLIVLVALRRESVGSDTQNYIYYFRRFSNMSWGELNNQSLEIGFAYLNMSALL